MKGIKSAEKAKKVEIMVEYFGKKYQVEAIVFAKKKIGERVRRCVLKGCQGRVKKEIFAYQLSRFVSVKDQNGNRIFCLSYIYRQIQLDIKKIVIEANKILNLWPDKLSPIDIHAPEFQPDGLNSLDERLVLCDDCVSLRQAILEKELLEGEEAMA